MNLASPKPVVLVTNWVPAEALEPLEGLAEVVLGPKGGDLMPRSEVLSLVSKVTAIINQAELRVDQELLDHAPSLKVVANTAIGVDNLDLALLRRRGIFATNAPDAFTDATADFALGLIIALCRRIVEADRYVRSGRWTAFQPGVWDGILLRGKILGLVGYGRIGQAVATRARAFGMEVIHFQRTARRHPGWVPLSELLGTADVVSLHVPLNAQSNGLIQADHITRMKPGACLINLARGRVIDEPALLAALESGRLAGAALDVFPDEPNVHPALREMRQVILTPHIGGGTKDSRFAARHLSARNVAAVLQNHPPLTPV